MPATTAMSRPETAVPASIDIQLAADDAEPPQPGDLRAWAAAALTAAGREHAAITVRVVSRAEGRELNCRYRDRDYATNVLSFPFSEVPAEVMAELGGDYIGDLAICADVVAREAVEQGKTRQAHWAHMVVHGVLHLAGFDHEDAAAAERMEALEREILADLGVADPWPRDGAGRVDATGAGGRG